MTTARDLLDAYFQLVLAGGPAGCVTVEGPVASGKLTLTKQVCQDFAARHGNAQVVVLPHAGLEKDTPQGVELAKALLRTLEEPGFHLVVILDEAERIAPPRLRRAVQGLRSTNGNLTLILVGDGIDLNPGNLAA